LPQAEPEPDWEIVKQILSYFVRNPKAADSLEGVARWRLLEEQVRSSLQQTEAALAWLVSQGFLEDVQTAGSNHIFRLDPNRYADAMRVLGSQEGTRDKKS
jgi:hypothetical protein